MAVAGFSVRALVIVRMVGFFGISSAGIGIVISRVMFVKGNGNPRNCNHGAHHQQQQSFQHFQSRFNFRYKRAAFGIRSLRSLFPGNRGSAFFLVDFGVFGIKGFLRTEIELAGPSGFHPALPLEYDAFLDDQ